MKKAVAYTRFSSSGQREESIDAQLRAIKKFCNENNYALTNIYIDEALSGRTDDRPQFLKMIKDSEKGLFDYVVVHKLDRFSRDRYDSAVYKRKLKQNGVRLLSVLEQLNDSPESIIMESILEGMNEYYSANLSREVLKGMKENAYNCLFNGGPVPLGYDIVDKKYVINEYEAKIVKTIFKMYANGFTVSKICNHLNSKGYRTKRGNKFNKNSFERMLKNPLYKGEYRFNLKKENPIVIEDGVPAIVSKKLFAEVNKKMKDISWRNSKNSDYVYLLTGILYHEDGGEMVGVSGNSRNKTYYYYRCKNCKIYERADKLESKIVKMFEEVLFHEDNIEILINDMYEALQAKTDGNIVQTLSNEISSIEIKIENLVNSIASGLTSSSIVQTINELEEQKSQLEAERDALLENSDITKESIREFIYTKKEKMNYDRETLKSILQSFLERITIHSNHVAVTLRGVEKYSYPNGFGVPIANPYEYKIVKNQILIAA